MAVQGRVSRSRDHQYVGGACGCEVMGQVVPAMLASTSEIEITTYLGVFIGTQICFENTAY